MLSHPSDKFRRMIDYGKIHRKACLELITLLHVKFYGPTIFSLNLNHRLQFQNLRRTPLRALF